MSTVDNGGVRPLVSRILPLLAVAAAAVVGTASLAAPAHAEAPADIRPMASYNLIDVATRLCLDSNAGGAVYTLTCNGGSFQHWWLIGPGYSELQNIGTARCLDSNYGGNVYTNPCQNGNTYQQWDVVGFQLVNRQTRRCLDSNWNGQVYTLPCNGGDFQKWATAV